MSLQSWWSKRIAKRRLKASSEKMLREAPLREFVYLDAVSLHSLLVSQNTTIPENVSEAITRADEAELKSGFGSDIVIAKADIAARYQTSNSSNIQSSRKAVIQTLFKEFRDLPLDFKLAPAGENPKPFASAEAIGASTDPSGAESSTVFTRGTLVEVEVTLAVDPVFKLSTMLSEFTAMVDDFPALVTSQEMLRQLSDAQPVMKVLDRFLTGLIPIKATAFDYVVAEVAGVEHIVHKSAINHLELVTLPLTIVGVTEHLGYWKDIRRVLFSEGRFTMLCRVARDGIHKSWTPVKLADVFGEVVPGLVDQINSIEFSSAAKPNLRASHRSPLSDALTEYKKQLVLESGGPWPDEAEVEFGAVIAGFHQESNASATAQRAAFNEVKTFVVAKLGTESMPPQADLEARQEARRVAGLTLLPSAKIAPSRRSNTPHPESGSQERMLDVEVIAIYW